MNKYMSQNSIELKSMHAELHTSVLKKRHVKVLIVACGS